MASASDESPPEDERRASGTMVCPELEEVAEPVPLRASFVPVPEEDGADPPRELYRTPSSGTALYMRYAQDATAGGRAMASDSSPNSKPTGRSPGEAVPVTGAIIGADPETDGRVLPAVRAVLERLDEELGEEGLWRKAGKKEEVERLEVCAGERFELDQLLSCHSLPTLMVRLLQRSPLVHPEAAAQAMAMVGTPECSRQAMERLLRAQLSPAKWALLEAFLLHWRRVVVHADNQMNATNLATCVFLALSPGVLDLKMRTVVETLLTPEPGWFGGPAEDEPDPAKSSSPPKVSDGKQPSESCCSVM